MSRVHREDERLERVRCLVGASACSESWSSIETPEWAIFVVRPSERTQSASHGKRYNHIRLR